MTIKWPTTPLKPEEIAKILRMIAGALEWGVLEGTFCTLGGQIVEWKI